MNKMKKINRKTLSKEFFKKLIHCQAKKIKTINNHKKTNYLYFYLY